MRLVLLLLVQDACFVCGGDTPSGSPSVESKGRGCAVCGEACREEFLRLEHEGRLDSVTGRVEPRSALFQEDSGQSKPLGRGYFYLGMYVLAGLVCGGAASYTAIQKGLNPTSAFLLGLFLNLGGLAAVAMTRRKGGEIPSPGLSKVPSTQGGIPCRGCGHSNHPSASKCLSCGGPLTPLGPSEAAKA